PDAQRVRPVGQPAQHQLPGGDGERLERGGRLLGLPKGARVRPGVAVRHQRVRRRRRGGGAAAEQGSEDALLGRRHVGGRRIEYVLAHAVSPAPGAGSTCNRSTLWYGPPCQTVCRAGRQWSASPTGPGRLGCRSRWGKLLLVTWTRSRCPGAKRHAVSPSSRSASYGSSCGAPPAPSSRRLASATSSERPSGHTSVSLATTAVAGASEPKRSRSRRRPTTSSGSLNGSEVYRSTSGLLSRCAWLSGPAASRPSWSTRPPCEGTGSSGS